MRLKTEKKKKSSRLQCNLLYASSHLIHMQATKYMKKITKNRRCRKQARKKKRIDSLSLHFAWYFNMAAGCYSVCSIEIERRKKNALNKNNVPFIWCKFLPWIFCLLLVLNSNRAMFSKKRLITSYYCQQWRNNMSKPKQILLSRVLFVLFCVARVRMKLVQYHKKNRQKNGSIEHTYFLILHTILPWLRNNQKKNEEPSTYNQCNVSINDKSGINVWALFVVCAFHWFFLLRWVCRQTTIRNLKWIFCVKLKLSFNTV